MSKKNIIITTTVAAVALFAGVGIGTSGQPEPRTETKIETKTVTKEVTTQACLTALENGENLIQLSGEGMIVMSGAFDTSIMFDVAALESITAELNALESDVTLARIAWDASVAECKANQ